MRKLKALLKAYRSWRKQCEDEKIQRLTIEWSKPLPNEAPDLAQPTEEEVRAFFDKLYAKKDAIEKARTLDPKFAKQCRKEDRRFALYMFLHNYYERDRILVALYHRIEKRFHGRKKVPPYIRNLKASI